MKNLEITFKMRRFQVPATLSTEATQLELQNYKAPPVSELTVLVLPLPQPTISQPSYVPSEA